VTQRQRVINLAIAAVIAVVAVVVIIATSGGSGGAKRPTTTTSEPGPPEILIKHGKVVGGIARFRVKQGTQLRFTVRSDVADEVHVHAYDLHQDVRPGHPVTFNFKANITGVMEAELESRKLQIASIRVDPR
jgi:hypothetical protein